MVKAITLSQKFHILWAKNICDWYSISSLLAVMVWGAGGDTRGVGNVTMARSLLR